MSAAFVFAEHRAGGLSACFAANKFCADERSCGTSDSGLVRGGAPPQPAQISAHDQYYGKKNENKLFHGRVHAIRVYLFTLEC